MSHGRGPHRPRRRGVEEDRRGEGSVGANAHKPFEKPCFTGSLYLRCDDVDAMWTQVKDRARICYPIENFAYGMREFAIYDNNGYLLQFGQEIA